MLSTLITLATAHAAPGAALIAGATGGYVLSDSPSTLGSLTRAALEKTLEPMSLPMRMIASSRLEEIIAWCSGYQFAMTDTHMNITCDSKPTIHGPLNGTMTPYTNDAGKFYSVEVVPGEDHAVVTYSGDGGAQVTTYRFTEAGLTVAKEIRNEYLEVPLRWETHYKRQ